MTAPVINNSADSLILPRAARDKIGAAFRYLQNTQAFAPLGAWRRQSKTALFMPDRPLFFARFDAYR
jgi:hypothetical protein